MTPPNDERQVPDHLRDAARQIAALRRQVTTTCEVCGTTITGTAKRRYCSDRCRQRAHYQRTRAQGAEQGPDEEQNHDG